MRPEEDEKNDKYVEWNASFKANVGIEKGQRAVRTKTGELCEVLRRFRTEGPMDTKGMVCEVSLPRLGRVEDIKLCEIEPYSYKRSTRMRAIKGRKQQFRNAKEIRTR